MDAQPQTRLARWCRDNLALYQLADKIGVRRQALYALANRRAKAVHFATLTAISRETGIPVGVLAEEAIGEMTNATTQKERA